MHSKTCAVEIHLIRSPGEKFSKSRVGLGHHFLRNIVRNTTDLSISYSIPIFGSNSTNSNWTRNGIFLKPHIPILFVRIGKSGNWKGFEDFILTRDVRCQPINFKWNQPNKHKESCTNDNNQSTSFWQIELTSSIICESSWQKSAEYIEVWGWNKIIKAPPM